MLSLCLPETKDVPLAQTIDEGEKLADKMFIAKLFRSVEARIYKLVWSLDKDLGYP